MVAGCCALINGGGADSALVMALGGPPARGILDGDPRADQQYWLRVWGVRGLLWVWDDSAWDAIFVALHDPQWRVREMAAKAVARHQLGDCLAVVAELRTDPVQRVRAAANRAVALLTRSGA